MRRNIFWASEMEGWRLSKCTKHVQTSSRPLTHWRKSSPSCFSGGGSPPLPNALSVRNLHTGPQLWTGVDGVNMAAGKNTRHLFTSPSLQAPASGTVWCACAALCMYKVLICSLFTILPTRTDGSLCVCTTCQLKWKCVASRRRVRIRNVPAERETPPERRAGKLKSKVRYMNRWKGRGRGGVG